MSQWLYAVEISGATRTPNPERSSSSSSKYVPEIYLAYIGTTPTENAGSTRKSQLVRPATVLHGRALGAAVTTSHNDYFSYNENQLSQILSEYLKTRKGIDLESRGILLLDIEHPVHASKFFRLSTVKLKQQAESLALRIRVARRYFPRAKIGLYGLFTPTSSCDWSNIDTRRLNTLKELYSLITQKEVLDFATAVSYMRQDKHLNGRDLNECLASKNVHAINIMRDYGLNLYPMLGFRLINKKLSADRSWVGYKAGGSNYLMQSLIRQTRKYISSNVSSLIYWGVRPDVFPEDNINWNVNEVIDHVVESAD